ncbi:MAG: hypothetical protein FJ109_14600 [Deltaproteobacteria bacterium]|nr:hypothetical protein [Deltaproteobacteria bacterium]
MALDIPGIRPAVLRRTTAATLDEFLRFRHLVRNVYGFELHFDRVLDLASRLEPVRLAVQADLAAFADFLVEMSREA